jgi:hypothetical protein
MAAIDRPDITSSNGDAAFDLGATDSAAGDGADRDASTDPDARGDGKASLDSDATFADSMDADGGRFAGTDGDGGCECIPWGADILVTTSLECSFMVAEGTSASIHTRSTSPIRASASARIL